MNDAHYYEILTSPNETFVTRIDISEHAVQGVYANFWRSL